MKTGDIVGTPVEKSKSPGLVTGCHDCPCASWDIGEEEMICGLKRSLVLPVDSEGWPVKAVPSECPLWSGTAWVKLEKLEKK